jgi:hypothetical protein
MFETRSKQFTFFTQLETSVHVGSWQEGSQIKGKVSLAQEVRANALELSALLEALKARQWS